MQGGPNTAQLLTEKDLSRSRLLNHLTYLNQAAFHARFNKNLDLYRLYQSLPVQSTALFCGDNLNAGLMKVKRCRRLKTRINHSSGHCVAANNSFLNGTRAR